MAHSCFLLAVWLAVVKQFSEAQITNVLVAQGNGVCTSGCCAGTAPCCESTTTVFFSRPTDSPSISPPPTYTVGPLSITTSAGTVDSFSWRGDCPSYITDACLWNCGPAFGRPCTTSFKKLSLPSVSTEDRGPSLSCGDLISNGCRVTLCIKVCVTLPMYPGSLQITPNWDTTPSPCTPGTDLCFKSSVVSCPFVVGKQTSFGVDINAMSKFSSTLNKLSADACNVGWFQRSGDSALIPDETLAIWTDPTKTKSVGFIAGSPSRFQLSIPMQVGTTTWFSMGTQRDFASFDILAVEDPGLPLNMTMSPVQFGGTCGNAFCRTVDWTPLRGQADATWQAHFVGRSQCCANGDCLPTQFTPLISAFLVVTGPQVMWSAAADALPAEVAVTAGQELRLELECTVFHGQPALALANASLNGLPTDAPMGLDLSLFQASAAQVGCRAGSAANPLRCAAAGVVAVATRAEDQGSVREWCFACRDAPAVRPALHKCLRVRTNLCQYQAQPGDSLLSVTRHFYGDGNWARLWNANPWLMDPDLGRHPAWAALGGGGLLAPGSVLRLGPVYTARPGDTLTTVAGALETTVKAILRANPHIPQDGEGELRAGTPLCILACSRPASS